MDVATKHAVPTCPPCLLRACGASGIVLGGRPEQGGGQTIPVSAVSESIVREYFELLGFLVRQQRKHVSPMRRDDEEIDFFVWNPQPEPGDLPFELGVGDARRIARGIVVVKAWHTEVFGPGMLAGTPEMFRFAEPGSVRKAERAFPAGASVCKVLVIPALPSAAAPRAESIALLRDRGVDAVLPFRTVLSALVDATEPNRNYQKSDVLQMLRILKQHGFLREPQLELFRAGRARRKGADGTSAGLP